MKTVCYRSSKNSQNDRAYASVTSKQCDISASRLQRMLPTFSKSVRSVTVLKLGCTNWFSLIVVLKPVGSINEMLLVQEVLQWSAVLLARHSKTVHSRHSQASMPRDTPCINRDMRHWPANITDLNPVDYHILWCSTSEIQVAVQHIKRLCSKPSTFLAETI